MTDERSQPGKRLHSPAPFEPPSAPAVVVADPMAVHRDPSRGPSTSPATIASRARVRASYDWLRLADLGVLAGQGAVGQGISLEREIMRRTRERASRAVRTAGRRSGTIPQTAPSASTSPAAAGAAEEVSL